jgi:hypothetical protein
MMLRIPAAGFAALSLMALGACSSTGSGEGGNALQNLLLYGGPTVPPAAPRPAIEVADCPPVTVGEGGAALRAVAGGEGAIRSQISIANVARECTGREDGSIVVKVGVEGRALLGPGGSPGRFEAPVTIELKRGERVLSRRTVRAPVTIPSGRFEQNFVIVEDNFVVPPETGEFDIEVSLGGSGGSPARTRRGRS